MHLDPMDINVMQFQADATHLVYFIDAIVSFSYPALRK